jgi:hypothetical protein
MGRYFRWGRDVLVQAWQTLVLLRLGLMGNDWYQEM